MNKKLIAFLILVVAALISAYIYYNQPNTTLVKDETAFAVANTDAIDRIFIATAEGAIADLTLENGSWYINGKHKAKERSVKLILETLRKLQVEAAVPEEGKEHALRSLSVRHKKIELYKNGEDSPFKTIFMGSASQLLNGNLCLLETREMGRASKPFYVGKKGHRGIIAPIFFIKESDWISNAMYTQSVQKIDQIKLHYPDDPKQSFTLVYDNNEVMLLDKITGKPLPKQEVNNLALDQYIKRFSNVYFDRVVVGLERSEVDSILQSPPIAEISVRYSGQRPKSIKLFKKIGFDRDIDYKPIGKRVDVDYYYAYTENKFVLCQRPNFDPLLVSRGSFLLPKD